MRFIPSENVRKIYRWLDSSRFLNRSLLSISVILTIYALISFIFNSVPIEKQRVTNVSQSVDSFCTYTTCFNVTSCAYGFPGFPLNQLRVFVYPSVYFKQISPEEAELLEAIRRSKYAVEDPRIACLVLPPSDLLDRSDWGSKYNPRHSSILPIWQHGWNKIHFSIIPSSSAINIDGFILAASDFTWRRYRPTFDISIPAFNPLTAEWKHEHNNRRIHLLTIHSTYYAEDGQMSDSLHGAPRDWTARLGTSSIISLNPVKSLTNNHIMFYHRSGKQSSTHYSSTTSHVFSYTDLLGTSLFCLITRAGWFGSLALFDSMRFGCVPVIIDDLMILPFSDVIDWHRFTLRIPNSQRANIISIISKIDLDQLHELQHQLKFVFERYFSTIGKIALTSLDIINDRTFPHLARSYEEWNERDRLKINIPSLLFMPTRTSVANGFTAVIRAHSHFNLLQQLLSNLEHIHYLRLVLIVWTNPVIAMPPASLLRPVSVPIICINGVSADGSSLLYYPHEYIKTEAILYLDESQCMPSAAEIEHTFYLWCENAGSLVGGFSLRSYQPPNNPTLSATFGITFLHTNFLNVFKYHPEVAFLRDLINSVPICESLIMNNFFAYISKQPVIVSSIQHVLRTRSGNSSTNFDSQNLSLHSCCLVPCEYPCWRQFHKVEARLNKIFASLPLFNLAPLTAVFYP